MPENSPMSPRAATPNARKSPIGVMIAVLFVVAALVLGYVIGVTKGQKDGYAKGLSAAQTGGTQRPIPNGATTDSPVEEPREVLSVAGRIVSMQADGFMLEVTQGATTTTRTVHVTGGTAYVRSVAKPAEEFAQEYQAYLNNSTSQTDDTPVMPPSRLAEQPAIFADLHEGIYVTVDSDVDIATATTVDATKVRINEEIATLDPTASDPASPEAAEAVANEPEMPPAAPEDRVTAPEVPEPTDTAPFTE